MNPIANYNLSNLNQAFQIFNELENFINQGKEISINDPQLDLLQVFKNIQ